VGRVLAVGRDLGVGVTRGVLLGVPVAVAVAVAVAVGVMVGVVEAVTVGLGLTVGVGEGPDCAQYLPPLFNRSERSSRPPQTIISLSAHTAV
jgi:hypothetical protein